MDSNWRPSQGDPTAGGGPASGPDPIPNPDWRSQLPPESRPRIVSKIMDTLKRHLPGSVPEGLKELQKIAVRFEEKIYSAATSQPDYLRKISLKMLSMETKAQGPQINPASNPNLQNLQNPNRMDPGGMQAQAGTNPAQSLSMPQTFQTNSTNQSMPPVAQQMPAGMNSLAQPDLYANAQRGQQNQMQQNQMQQNQIPQNQTQQNQMVYQQIMRQKLLQQHQMSSGLTGQSGITAGGGMTAGSGGMQVQHNQLNPLQQHQQLQMQQNQMQQNQMMNMNDMNNMNNSNNMMVGARGNNNNNNMNNMQQRRMQQMSQQNQNQQYLLSQFQNQQPMQQQQQQQQQGGNNNNNINNNSNNSNNMMQLQQQQRSATMLQTQNGGNNNNMNKNDGINNNVMDQQKQFMQQQQRVIQDVASSPASIDSTAQTGPSELAIEEVYQKLKSLKEAYFMELKDMYKRVAIKLHQINPALIEDPKAAEQIEKLKNFKTVLDRLLYVLQLNKQTLQHQANMKEKLNAYEKQIISILQNHKNQIPPAQQPQIPPAQQPQIPQAQQDDPQQQIENQNHQMQGNNFNMQNNDQMQPNAFNTMNGMNPPQAVGTGMMISSHNGMMSQQNLGMKQQQEEVAQQQQRFIQQNQMKQRHMQQMLQTQNLQQQQHLPLQQIQQQKQQNIINNNSQQSGQLNYDSLTDIKPRQAGLKPNNPYQPLYPGMNSCTGYFHPQLKPGTNLPVSSPQQNLQSSSSPSSQIDQVKLERTLLQPASSPFLPSPSPPVAPHLLIPDETKPVPSLHNNSSPLVQLGQPGQIPSQSVQSIGVGTPGISASPLFAEFTSPEAGRTRHHVSTQVDRKSTVDETPIERLAKALRAGSNHEMHNLIRSSITDIGSVVSMVDRVAWSAPVNGSRAAVGDDLAAMTKFRIPAKHLPALPDQPAAKKMKRDTSAMPLNGNGSGGGGNGSGTGGLGSVVDGLELESDATSRVRVMKSEMNHGLMQEIKEINSRLIDTELTLTEEESVSSTASSSIASSSTAISSTIASSASSEGTVIKCIYTAVAISPGLRSHFASSQLSPILPLRLLLPSSYPKCSPIILDKLPEEQSRDFDDLSTKARSRFSASLRGFSEPLSLKEMAKMWDACARGVILEYAMKIGGGSFSFRYATWKTCVGA